MVFEEKIDNFKKRICGMFDSFSDMTEEATKTALIMPFLRCWSMTCSTRRSLYRNLSAMLALKKVKRPIMPF